MKTLIIPDIHQKIKKADLIFKKESFDRVVFLGDYFDCLEGEGIKETCEWLRNKFYELGDKAVWLIGNHDVPYFEEISKGRPFARQFSQKNYCCTGYSRNRAKTIIRKDLKEFFNNTKIFCIVDGYLLSHAGIHPTKLKPFISMEDNLKFYEDEWEDLKNKLHIYKSRLYDIGEDRGGKSKFGDILWLDWKNLEPIDGMNQIVGHSESDIVRSKGNNFCLDCGLNYYGVIEDGCLTSIKL